MMGIEKMIDVGKKINCEEINFQLNETKSKPVFVSVRNSSNEDFVCMLDSGAGIPVWCSGKEALLHTFSNAMLRPDLKSILSGFGLGFEIVDVYYIPQIEICNGKISIVFKEFYLPVVNKNTFGADLILPSAMLKNSNVLLSQFELYDLKELTLQCHTLHFRARYSVRNLSLQVVKNLQKICPNQNITIGTKLLGGEGEFYQVFVQEDNSAGEILLF